MRGAVMADVWSRGKSATPPCLAIYECKLWENRIPPTAAHAPCAVLADSGSKAGVLLDPNGF